MTTVFDISSDIAMFRKPYTTTSSQSYPFPPPSSVAGIVSAILGFKNNSEKCSSNAHYWIKVIGTRIAIKLNKPVKWETHSLNYYNTKSGNRSIHTQIKHQFLKKPSFRIFVQGSLEEQLSENLEKERFVFTPYLGVAYAIADIKYLGRFEEKNFKTTEIHSVIPYDTEEIEPDVKKTLNLNISDVPFEFTSDRTLKSIKRVVYKMDSKPIYLKQAVNGQKIAEDSVMWFPLW
jgi:CRISPR-associated protein Cas5h